MAPPLPSCEIFSTLCRNQSLGPLLKIGAEQSGINPTGWNMCILGSALSPMSCYSLQSNMKPPHLHIFGRISDHCFDHKNSPNSGEISIVGTLMTSTKVNESNFSQLEHFHLTLQSQVAGNERKSVRSCWRIFHIPLNSEFTILSTKMQPKLSNR